MANLAHTLHINNLRHMNLSSRSFMTSSLIMLVTLAWACKESPTASTGKPNSSLPTDLQGLAIEDIPGSDIKYARQVDSTGIVEIEGFVLDNKRTGMWIQYSDNGDIGLINHYVDGELEGVVLRMTYRNQVDLKSTYRKGQLHGPWVSYKFGKVIEERNYANGKLDGVVKLYDERTFKVKQEAQYKNGVQDGFFRYYDENGNITLEYEYKNGEKVAGGMK
jgi:hypothetical protein